MNTFSGSKIDSRNGISDLELTKDNGIINFGEQKFSGPGALPRASGAFGASSNARGSAPGPENFCSPKLLIPSSFVNSRSLFPFLLSAIGFALRESLYSFFYRFSSIFDFFKKIFWIFNHFGSKKSQSCHAFFFKPPKYVLKHRCKIGFPFSGPM